MEAPFQPVVTAWLSKIKLALDFKRKRFQLDADEGMAFFAGPYDFLYKSDGTDRHMKRQAADEDVGEIPPPAFQMTCNKVAEMVQIFGPVLYHRNPVRQVNPRRFPDIPPEFVSVAQSNPQTAMLLGELAMQQQFETAVDKMRASLLSHYLNYTPAALDLKTESRRAIDEAIIKGMGCLWTEVYIPPGSSTKMVGSFYDSVDNLVIDPDCKMLREGKWVAKKCCKPTWEVERIYQLQPGSLRSNAVSTNALGEATATPEGDYAKQTGQTSDLITYWEIYSKCGIGGNLTGIPEQLKPMLSQYGDNVYLVIADGNDLPLNINPQLMQMDDSTGQAAQLIAQAVAWPTPFWKDGVWPFVPIVFHEIPEDPWPMSHLSPGMGELKFLNWMFSYLAGKIRITCRDFIAIDQSAAEDLVNTILHGTDLSLIKIKKSAGKSIDQVVQFLQHPNFNGDVWKLIDMVSELFDRRVGLTELMYGMSSASFRSAAEAQTKRDQMNVRPEDMANKVEDAMSQVARQEALAARWHLQPQDVRPVMGAVGEVLWGQYVIPSDPAEILFQLEYRIEAGSARKPNKDRDAANLQQATQTYGPFFQQLAMTGLQMGLPQFLQPFNTLLALWGKANDFETAGLLLPVPQPGVPALPAPAPEGDGESKSGPPK